MDAAASSIRVVADRAQHLHMVAVTDEEHRASGLRMDHHFQVHLAHEWTSGIENPQAARAGFTKHLRRSTMGTDHSQCTFWDLRNFVDKHRAEFAQAINDAAVVHD